MLSLNLVGHILCISLESCSWTFSQIYLTSNVRLLPYKGVSFDALKFHKKIEVKTFTAGPGAYVFFSRETITV